MIKTQPIRTDEMQQNNLRYEKKVDTDCRF